MSKKIEPKLGVEIGIAYFCFTVIVGILYGYHINEEVNFLKLIAMTIPFSILWGIVGGYIFAKE